MIPTITEAEVEKTLDMAQAVACVEEALHLCTEGAAVNDPRHRTRIPTAALHLLPAALPEKNLLGFKAYTSSRQGVVAHTHLFAADSGRPLAIVESNHLGRLRTGAVAALAAKQLARADSRTVGLFGCGYQATTQLEGLRVTMPVEQVQVVGRNSERLKRFCDLQAERLGLLVQPARSAQEMVEESDILVTATTATTPLFDGRWLQPGQHINAIGSNALIRREIDETAIRRCERIVVDDRRVAEKECGDLLPSTEKGRLHWHQLPELGEILTDRYPGRTNAQQITLFESQGMGLLDLALANHLLNETTL